MFGTAVFVARHASLPLCLWHTITNLVPRETASPCRARVQTRPTPRRDRIAAPSSSIRFASQANVTVGPPPRSSSSSSSSRYKATALQNQHLVDAARIPPGRSLAITSVAFCASPFTPSDGPVRLASHHFCFACPYGGSVQSSRTLPGSNCGSTSRQSALQIRDSTVVVIGLNHFAVSIPTCS